MDKINPELRMPMYFEVGGVSSDLPPSTHLTESATADQGIRTIHTVEYGPPGRLDVARKGSVAITGFSTPAEQLAPVAIADLHDFYAQADALRRAG